jgi:hypothetical protein
MASRVVLPLPTLINHCHWNLFGNVEFSTKFMLETLKFKEITMKKKTKKIKETHESFASSQL